MKRIVIESPLSGDFVRNFRFLLWCCRAVWLQDGAHAIGSHMLNPWFMDDTDPEDRAVGIACPWVWLGDPHWFFTDFGMSRGMSAAWERCVSESIQRRRLTLSNYHPACWAAFERGEFPPHTPGFEVKT